MSEYDIVSEDEEMTTFGYERIYLGIFHEDPEFAELRVATYPDGRPMNHLRSEHLRVLAQMMLDAADELEDE